MDKLFDVWMMLKRQLHQKVHRGPYVSEGDIWWASVGENVGFEVNGKSKLFSRPVIIYKKLTHEFYLVIPTTTKPKRGTWYVPFRQSGKEMVACLHQMRTIDFRRLWSKLGMIDDEDKRRVQTGFRLLYH